MMRSPLRVMIDARMLLGRFSGVSRFVTRLADELARQDGVTVIALCGNEPPNVWRDGGGIEIVTSSFSRRDRTAARRVWWEERHLGGLIRRAHADLYHATWNSGIPAACPVPAILTLHDLIPWHDPSRHFATRFQRVAYRYGLRASARRASRVTTVSEHVRRQVLTTLGVNAGKVVVVPNGVDLPSGRPATSEPDAPPYVLYIGGHQPRKNVAAVLAAIRRYWEQFDDKLELRLTGQAASLAPPAAEVYRQIAGTGRLRFLGSPSDEELARQYASARCLLLLSHYEGFGLPVLEAMAHGCPVVAAANASLPEVTGDAGILVNPSDADEVARAMRRLVSEPAHRAALIRLGKARAASYSWQDTALRMRGIYEEACSAARLPAAESRSTFHANSVSVMPSASSRKQGRSVHRGLRPQNVLPR
jgi:glycosyltransferase involved in cell wall biosynthesis